MAEASPETSGAGGRPPAPFATGAASDDRDPFTRSDEPVWRITLWPYRSFSRENFRTLMCWSAAAMALPVLALSRTPAALALAPYALVALLAFWALFRLSYRSGRVTEEIRLWPDAIAVERREPRGRIRRWSANPYWVDVQTEETRTISHYLTLRGGGRRIELGAFLTPDERVALADELRARIAGLNRPL